MHINVSAGYDHLMTMDPVQAFQTLEMRVGRVVRVEPNERARRPALKLWIDFGDRAGGLKTSSAQLTDLYGPDDLIGRLVIAAVNLPPRRIAGFRSDVLVLGVPDADGRVVLLAPDQPVPLGERVF